jgi:hypothetical protein
MIAWGFFWGGIKNIIIISLYFIVDMYFEDSDSEPESFVSKRKNREDSEDGPPNTKNFKSNHHINMRSKVTESDLANLAAYKEVNEKSHTIVTSELREHEWYSPYIQNKLEYQDNRPNNFLVHHRYIPRIPQAFRKDFEKYMKNNNMNISRDRVIDKYPWLRNQKNANIDYFIINKHHFANEYSRFGGKRRKSNKRRRSNKKNIKRTTLKSNKSNKRHKVNRR